MAAVMDRIEQEPVWDKDIPLWANIPTELRGFNQWLISAPTTDIQPKRPLYVDRFGIRNASIHKPDQFMAFDEACAKAAMLRASTGLDYGVGFVLTAQDPFCVIDLDDKPAKPASPQDHALFRKIIETYDTYTEISSSGRGAHLVLKATGVDLNFHRGHVELYTRNRFMVITGNVIRANPIVDVGTDIQAMADKMSVKVDREEWAITDAGQETKSDEEVFNACRDSANGEKFMTLWQGNFQDVMRANGTPMTGSEGDMALLQFLWFHSRNRAQCARMFRWSKLAERDAEKMARDDYIVRTLAATVAKLREDELLQSSVSFEESFMGIPPIPMPGGAEIVLATSNGQVQPDFTGLMAQANAVANGLKGDGTPDKRRMQLETPLAMQKKDIPEPFGKFKELVDYIQSVSMFPVREIAVAGALGLLAGISGCAYQARTQVSSKPSALNQYFILVARSGTGKETMRSSIRHIIRELEKDQVPVGRHVDFNEYGSPESLHADCILLDITNYSKVHVTPEWGQLMKIMNDKNNVKNAAMYRRIQLDMFSAGDVGGSVAGRVLRDKEKRAESRSAFAYSILSETNPSTFDEAFDSDSGEDGFMSRIFVIEYEGVRPPRQRVTNTKVPNVVLESLKLLVNQVRNIEQTIPEGASMIDKTRSLAYTPVNWSAEASDMLDNYLVFVDDEIRRYQNLDGDDSRQHIWMRADLKMIRLASLLAAFENPFEPVVTKQMCQWAIDMLAHSAHTFMRRYAQGKLGAKGQRTYTIVLNALRNIFSNNLALTEEEQMFLSHGIVLHSPLFTKVSSQIARGGESPARAMKEVMQALMDEGRIVKVTEAELRNQFNKRGLAYRILNLS